MFNSHTRFQLYHCKFPREYLIQLRDTGIATTGVTLNRTKMFDFANLDHRAEWFDLFIALMQYLKSGEAKVGYLNRLHPKNALHRDVETTLEQEESSENVEDVLDWKIKPVEQGLKHHILPSTGDVAGDGEGEAKGEDMPNLKREYGLDTSMLTDD